LKPAEAPTASLTFNMSTLGGTAVGIGLASNFVTEREKFHSSSITQAVSLYDSSHADRIAALSSLIGDRVTDDAMATVLAVSRLGEAARLQAWVLAFNDAFLAVAVVLAVCMLGTFAIARTVPLKRRQPSGEKS
jgi:DHA2 family multidrug resistance protein